MFGWFKAKSPLTAEQREWIDSRFEWLLTEFGAERLRGVVVLPTDEFFPDRYAGTTSDATVLFERLCGYMKVDPAQVQLSFYTADAADDAAVAFRPELNGSYALGLYSNEGKRENIWLEQTRLNEPTSIVATLAHELAHVYLLGDGRYSAEAADHEPLTDLLTVFFGLGIFTANSVIREANWRAGNWSGWNVSRQGYLSLAEYAYALAIYALARGEHKPSWARHLRPDVRSLFQSDLKYLARGAKRPAADSVSADEEPIADDDPIDLIEDRNDSNQTIPDDEHLEMEDDTHESEHEIIVPVSGKADAAFSRGIVYASEGQFDQAVVAYTEALKFKSRDIEALVHRAQAYNSLGEYTKAAEDSTRALQYEPENEGALCCRGIANVWLGNFADAIPDATRALRQEPKDPTGFFIRGVAQLALGEHRRAIADLSKAICYAPSWASCYLARSKAYEAVGKIKHAQVDVFDAVRCDESLKDENVRASYLPNLDGKK